MKNKRLLNLAISTLVATHTFFAYNVTSLAAANEVNVVLDGQTLNFDVPAQIINDRTMVPMRAIFEELGAAVEWDAEEFEVTAYKPGVLIQMQIGNTTIYRNTVEQTIDVPAQLVNDRTLVPVRFVSEYMGAIVTWDAETQTVHITSTDNIQYIDWNDNYEYYGEVENGKATGYGLLSSKTDGSLRQIGKYIDSKIVVGTDYFDNEEWFSGNYVDGYRSYGTYYYNDGTYYVGEFQNSAKHGKGTLYFNDGSYHDGLWAESLPNGYGIYYDAVEDFKVQGNFTEGQRDGYFIIEDFYLDEISYVTYIDGEVIYTSTTPHDYNSIIKQTEDYNKQVEELNKEYQELNEKYEELNEEYEDLDEWYREEMAALYEYITDGDPFSTDWAESIYQQYGVSTGSSPADANLDSFAAANALRQQAAIKAKADTAILEYNQTYIDNRKNLIEDTYKQQKQHLDTQKQTLDMLKQTLDNKKSELQQY